MIRTRYFGLITFLIFAACASGPTIQSQYDQEINFANYQTFGFVPTHPDDTKFQYATLLDKYLKQSARAEMEKRGYVYSEANPDLIINFKLNKEDKMDVRTSSSPAYTSYYGYRYGYGAWPGYYNETRVTQYTEGTLHIDLIDANKKQLVWEGLAIGRLNDDLSDRLPERTSAVVTMIFAEYPFRAGSNINQLQLKQAK